MYKWGDYFQNSKKKYEKVLCSILLIRDILGMKEVIVTEKEKEEEGRKERKKGKGGREEERKKKEGWREEGGKEGREKKRPEVRLCPKRRDPCSSCVLYSDVSEERGACLQDSCPRSAFPPSQCLPPVFSESALPCPSSCPQSRVQSLSLGG